MSNTILVIGQSGSGKSTSIRTLNPDETFVLNVLDKPLPFRGAGKSYNKISDDRLTGNIFATDNTANILKVISFINSKRPDIKNLIIDDFSYILTNEYMSRSMEVGYSKYSEMAKNSWQIIKDLNNTRKDLYCFVMAHSELDDDGRIKCKTIGKVLSNKVILEGMVTCCLHSICKEGEYKFLTQDTGTYLAKSPMGLFSDKLIDNDLQFVKDKMQEYYDEDIQM